MAYTPIIPAIEVPSTVEILARAPVETPAEHAALNAKIKRLLKERDAVIVAHYYVHENIQRLAEETGGYVSDSLDMARFGHEHPARTLVVAGVRFMGETAKILNPEKRVLMPAREAECSLDLACPAEQFVPSGLTALLIGTEPLWIVVLLWAGGRERVDLKAPLDADTRAALNAALSEHLALVIRDQHFTPDEFQAAADAFGTVMRQHYSQYNMTDFPNIGVIRHRGDQKPASMWHTDHTNRERPPKATILYGVEVAQGADTSIASMRDAYSALPESERRHLETLRTQNGLDENRTDVRAEDREKYDNAVWHPMVRTHPEHGSKAVYFHITKAHRIDGMTPQDSKAYMQDLLDRMIRPAIVYRHEWREGDLLIFDNRATLHRAHDDYDRSQYRELWRLIVEGDRPYLQ